VAAAAVAASVLAPQLRGQTTRWWTPRSLAESAHRELPWLTVNGELRSRFEAPTGLTFSEGNNDAVLLTRMRVSAGIKAKPWLELQCEWQDSRAFGKDEPVPGSMADTLDVRQAFLRLGQAEGPGLRARVGRQALKFGKGRLVWDPDWGNFGQVFDAVRVTASGRVWKLDAFAASQVVPRTGQFNRSNRSNVLYGLYSSAQRSQGRLQVEPYWLVKSSAQQAGESGRSGALSVHTVGARAQGLVSAAIDWELEVAHQTGRIAGGPVRAFGGVGQVGVRTGKQSWQPRLVATYMYGSGDSDPRDGKRGTFDSLYPSVHLRNGATDRIGWANIKDFSVQGEWQLRSKWKLQAGWHDFHVASRTDALYSPGGIAIVRNPGAPGTHVGWELFGIVEVQLTRAAGLSSGYAYLFRGPFLTSASRCGAAQPYLSLTYRY